MEIKRPTDEEVLAIIRKLFSADFKTEKEGSAALDYLQKLYPAAEMATLIFWNRRNLTPEQVLEEAKKAKPINL